MRSERRFRPMGIRDVLDETFDLYKSNFGALLAIVAIVQIPINVLSLYKLSESDTGPYGSSQLPYAILAFISNFLIAAPATWAVSEAYLGRRPSVRAAFWAIKLRVLPFMGTYLLWLLAVTSPMAATLTLSLTGLAVLLSSVIQGISGRAPAVMATALLMFALGAVAAAIWALIYVWIVFAPVLFVVEDKRYLSALKRSRDLVRGHWWRVFGTMLLAMLIVSIVHAGLVTPLRMLAGDTLYLWFFALSMVVAMALWPLPLITTILLYYDLRIRKEGFDLEMLATEMGRPSVPTQERE